MAVLDPRLSFQACYTRVCTYYTGGLWQGDARGLKGFLQRILRVLVLSVRGLIVNRSLIRASALAYLTGLAMIPIMALLFTILKSLGIQRLLAEPLLEHLALGSKEFGMRIPALLSNAPLKPTHVRARRCQIVLSREKKRYVDGSTSRGRLLNSQISFLCPWDLDEEIWAIRFLVQCSRRSDRSLSVVSEKRRHFEGNKAVVARRTLVN